MSKTEVFDLEIVYLKTAVQKLQKDMEDMEKVVVDIKLSVAKIVAIASVVNAIVIPVLVSYVTK
jgi:hypothetical protein